MSSGVIFRSDNKKQYWKKKLSQKAELGFTWSKYYEHCQTCKTTERKHHAKGFCRNCYKRYFRKKNLLLVREAAKAYYKKNQKRIDDNLSVWRKAHPDLTKSYDKKYREGNKDKRAAIWKKWYIKNKSNKNTNSPP